MDIGEVLAHGVLCCPASKAYPSDEGVFQVVTCDKCGARNLAACIHYDVFDICLTCASHAAAPGLQLPLTVFDVKRSKAPDPAVLRRFVRRWRKRFQAANKLQTLVHAVMLAQRRCRATAFCQRYKNRQLAAKRLADAYVERQTCPRCLLHDAWRALSLARRPRPVPAPAAELSSTLRWPIRTPVLPRGLPPVQPADDTAAPLAPIGNSLFGFVCGTRPQQKLWSMNW